MRAVQPLTDKVIETDPAKATTWFLQYDSAIEAILRLGKQNAKLGMQCFNVTNLYRICEKLPFSLQQAAYSLEEGGKEKLVKIIDMTSKVRYATEKRAQDRANQSSDPVTITNKIKPTQSEPAISANLTQTPNTNQTSRFDSWTLLCLGTERRYPDTDDIFHSAHYARRPRNFEQVPKARTNAECRICKIL